MKPDPSGVGQGGAPPRQLALRITSLEMRSRPARRAAEPMPAGTRIERAIRPAVPFYRFLYNTVGEPWFWTDRRRWSEAELAKVVQDPAVEVWVLSVDGQPAGYAELDRRIRADVELAYFGLMPGFIGRGLGTHLLRFAIDQAWDGGAGYLWVHTCNLDHPSALGLYKREGFVPFQTDDRWIEDPRIWPAITS